MAEVKRYISTVVPSGYDRYAIRMGGCLIGALDVPSDERFEDALVLARRWLLGEELPAYIRFWPSEVSRG